MKRRIYFNDKPNVLLYATEGGTNAGNCASGCNGCTNVGGGGGGGEAWVIALVGTVVGSGLTIATMASVDDDSLQ